MVFTGHRKDRYDIYTVDVDSGKETQMTDQQTLDDGPEYSPDGKYIFFNSNPNWKNEALANGCRWKKSGSTDL